MHDNVLAKWLWWLLDILEPRVLIKVLAKHEGLEKCLSWSCVLYSWMTVGNKELFWAQKSAWLILTKWFQKRRQSFAENYESF